MTRTVSKIPFRDDVEHEIESLSALVSLSRNDIVTVANRLKEATGFVARAGRYFYITPAIIARVAFQRAWNRWVHHDPGHFLKGGPAA